MVEIGYFGHGEKCPLKRASTKCQALRGSSYPPRKHLLAHQPYSVVSERMRGGYHIAP